MSESYRELYTATIEDARNRIVLEVQRKEIEHERQIEAAHKRIASFAKENSELRLALGHLQERVDKIAQWLKDKEAKRNDHVKTGV